MLPHKPVPAVNGETKITAVDSEIDIVATDAQRNRYLLGECKYRNAATELSDLLKLKEKASFIKSDAVVFYTLFSKSGFEKPLCALAENDPYIKLVSLEDIIGEQQCK